LKTSVSTWEEYISSPSLYRYFLYYVSITGYNFLKVFFAGKIFMIISISLSFFPEKAMCIKSFGKDGR
jgi:hypothetical protein